MKWFTVISTVLIITTQSQSQQQRFSLEFPLTSQNFQPRQIPEQPAFVQRQQFSPPTTQRPVPLIIKQINQHNEDGSYTFGFESQDGSYRVETKDLNGFTRGKYGYLDATGTLREVEYSAGGKFGYEPSGHGISVPPRAPPASEEEEYDDQGNPIGPKLRPTFQTQARQRFVQEDFERPLPTRQRFPDEFDQPSRIQPSSRPELTFANVQQQQPQLPVAPRPRQQIELPSLRESQPLQFAPRQSQPQVEVRLIDDLPPVAPAAPIRQSLPIARPALRQQDSPLDAFFNQLRQNQRSF